MYASNFSGIFKKELNEHANNNGKLKCRIETKNLPSDKCLKVNAPHFP